jgi:hypothetical protein
MPDFKTIANFSKGNGKAIRNVCRQFVAVFPHFDFFSDESLWAERVTGTVA